MTDYLFARPSFWSGIARVVDLGGRFDRYNTTATEAEADAQAIYSDWRAIGEDIARATAQFGAAHDPAKGT